MAYIRVRLPPANCEGMHVENPNKVVRWRERGKYRQEPRIGWGYQRSSSKTDSKTTVTGRVRL